jgi:60 kDa SS-A/Ro ribonucleoprotein
MANKSLFSSVKSLFSQAPAQTLPPTNTTNEAGGAAYAFGPEASLAQLAATGTLNDTAYRRAEDQLTQVLALAAQIDPLFVAKTAVYARSRGAMKDMPALLTAYLTVAEPDLAVRVFGRVIDNGRMLRTFVQIMRSGQVGRQSLGSRPKRLIRQWLEQASLQKLMTAATGKNPSLADIVKMVHPAPKTAQQRAFYGWLLGKPYDLAALPSEIAAFEAWKHDPSSPLPPVPFEWLTAFPLTPEQWADQASRMGWHALRMNLNTLARHGAFTVPGTAEMVAQRLADTKTLRKVQVMPYQLLVALGQVDEGVPLKVHAALEDALEASLSTVPQLSGRVLICPDVSGSMHCSATGYRPGASSVVRCIDVAALITAAVLRQNPQARVMPFAECVKPITLSPHARLAVNAEKLAALGGGGTEVSAPLAMVNAQQLDVDTVLFVSDNASWVLPSHHNATETMRHWASLKTRNPGAKMICLDIQPHTSTQAPDRDDIINIGGFSDAVFDTIADFANGKTHNWIEEITKTEV